MNVLLIILLAYLDRLRGTPGGLFPKDSTLLMGWCVSALYGHPFDLLSGSIAVAFMFGESAGWGEPIGAALIGKPMDQSGLEWWQVGILKTNVWLALTARGLLWGSPVALLGYFDPALCWLPAIIGMAMPVSAWIVTRTTKSWAHQEYLRGFLIGIMVSTYCS